MTWKDGFGIKQPVEVRNIDRLDTNSSLDRLGNNPGYQEVKLLGPEDNEIWIVESIHIEFNADGNAGDRYIWLYLKDSSGILQRVFVTSVQAGNLFYYFGQVGMAFSKQTDTGHITMSGPFYSDVIQYPIKFYAYWDNFQGAGDIFKIRALVNRRRA